MAVSGSAHACALHGLFVSLWIYLYIPINVRPACRASDINLCKRMSVTPQRDGAEGICNGVNENCDLEVQAEITASEYSLWLCDKRLLAFCSGATPGVGEDLCSRR